MAAITPFANTSAFNILRNTTAQANTGQTDWVPVPEWATAAEVFINLTAVAGTSPEMTPSFWAIDPVTYDDSYIVQLHGNFTAVPFTGAAFSRILIGPGTDDLALAATGSSLGVVATILPPILGCKLLLDRTTGNETYTYTLALKFI